MKAVWQLSVVIGVLLSTTVVNAEDDGTVAVKTITRPDDVKALMTVRCQPCHFELRIKPALLLNTGKWFRRSGDLFEIERRVFNESPPHSMPMGALLSEKEKATLRNWIKRLHKEL
jgi:hypothetical protein